MLPHTRRRRALADLDLIPLLLPSSLLPRSPYAEEMDKRAPIDVKFEIPYFTVSGALPSSLRRSTQSRGFDL